MIPIVKNPKLVITRTIFFIAFECDVHLRICLLLNVRR